MTKSRLLLLLVAFATLATMLSAGTAGAEPSDRASDVASYWTAERMANATPRDLFVDQRGLGYIRSASGGLEPYGHGVAAVAPSFSAAPEPKRPPSNDDTAPPVVSAMDPAGVDPIPTIYTFSATITDTSGIKSVSFEVSPVGGLSTSFAPSNSGDTWSIPLEFSTTVADWQWRVIAKDAAGRGGNTETTDWVPFTVGTGGTVSPPPDPLSDGGVTDATWNKGGNVATAAGRIYFEMPGNAKWKGPWNGYVCSGTVVTDSTTGRSVIITAAHCVYDDVNQAFARNVLFIPQQQDTTGTRTDLNCDNDPIGCWAPAFGVVDLDWTTRTFPDNIPWDFAYYVVDDADDAASRGSDANGDPLDGSEPLDEAVDPLVIQFGVPATDPGARTDAIGYSYSQDPLLRYCSEDLGIETRYDDLWLANCDLSGGSSGGPWQQGSNDGNGPIISVNSWGYTNQSGMGGPVLDPQASCLFNVAKTGAPTLLSDGVAGLHPDC
jgi:hypothetical protein